MVTTTVVTCRMNVAVETAGPIIIAHPTGSLATTEGVSLLTVNAMAKTTAETIPMKGIVQPGLRPAPRPSSDVAMELVFWLLGFAMVTTIVEMIPTN